MLQVMCIIIVTFCYKRTHEITFVFLIFIPMHFNNLEKKWFNSASNKKSEFNPEFKVPKCAVLKDKKCRSIKDLYK